MSVAGSLLAASSCAFAAAATASTPFTPPPLDTEFILPAFTVDFSAKESIFKCLYPEVRRYFDFLEAEVLELDPAAGRFVARLLVTLVPAYPAGYVVGGTFFHDAASVSTGVVLAP